MKVIFTSKRQREAIAGLLLAIILVCSEGCQTFSMSKQDVQKEQRGEMADPKTGEVVGVVGTAAYCGTMFGLAIAAMMGK